MTIFTWRRRGWLYFAAALVVVYFRALFLDVMDVDAAQYASIAMEMAQNGSWLQVQHRGADYLDKPPLLFWSAAAAFRIFGVSNWAYKLPSALAALLGVYAVFRFTLLFYGRDTARHAAFMLAGCIGLFLLVNDVRTDTLLLGFTAAAIWLLAEYLEKKRLLYLVGGFASIGFAMLAKGPLGLVMPGLAIATHLALTRRWKDFFRWQWLAGLVVTAAVLVPMSWGLYQQFDLQPEKVINGRSGVSGLYFFFWEQSFGRITGENVWRNSAPWYFFLHIYLWAFLPWAFLLIGALVQRLRNIFGGNTGAEGYSVGAFLLTFIALSLSKYKLPHYIFVTLPWAAVLTAAYLPRALYGLQRRSWWIAQQVNMAVVLIVVWALLLWIFPAGLGWVLLASGLLTGLTVLYAIRWHSSTEPDHLVRHGLFAVLTAGFVLHFHFYPVLLPYQSTATAARWAVAEGIAPERLAFFNRHGHTYDFYARYITRGFPTAEAVKAAAGEDAFWLYTNASGREKLDQAGVAYTVGAEIQHFQAALLNIKFLNPATRSSALQPVFMLKISSQ